MAKGNDKTHSKPSQVRNHYGISGLERIKRKEQRKHKEHEALLKYDKEHKAVEQKVADTKRFKDEQARRTLREL